MLMLGGAFLVERVRNGRVLSRHYAKNGLTLVGLNHSLDVVARQGSQSTWKMGLIAADGYDQVASSDTMSSHAGWTEAVSYTEANRPLWNPGAISGKLAVNPVKTVFTLNADTEVQGMFLVSDNTKSGTAGILLCTGIFDSPALMLSGELMRCFYRLSAEGR